MEKWRRPSGPGLITDVLAEAVVLRRHGHRSRRGGGRGDGG